MLGFPHSDFCSNRKINLSECGNISLDTHTHTPTYIHRVQVRLSVSASEIPKKKRRVSDGEHTNTDLEVELTALTHFHSNEVKKYTNIVHEHIIQTLR